MSEPFMPPSDSGDGANRALFRSFRFWIPAFVCLFALAAIPVAFLCGAVIGNAQVYRNFSDHQSERIESWIAQYPESFGGLTVEPASDGWAYPIGSVPQQSDYDLLSDALHEMFGDELAERMLRAVEIETGS
ncbi:hypothetical protein [Aporhodopirellula aestuarii]|uniref:Uncharacterized protein n=1 Tax=Aporhodopirellula aestuarii TaxID=2950107 RepID=A0ABT0TZN9_9BACT|nr:hypothetical protein [Aporhodopirellula aestuarii]MCM2370063.1 hypothetical protein [Aporhodopirellula aestuarii]